LNPDGPTVAAYGITDLIAEKLRALLQQVSRNRYRRQDVYDLAHLADRFSPDATECVAILRTLRDKCAARGIVPTAVSLDDAALVERARSEWHTLEQEVGELPDFDACLEKTRRLYRGLPWGDAAS
jgi:predicted nucleotidyltransferase component of viral defense system